MKINTKIKKKSKMNKFQKVLTELADTLYKPVIKIKESGIDGTYYSDGSGSLYLRLTKSMGHTRWWQSDKWGAEDAGIKYHIEYLNDDIEHAEDQIKLMKQARKILKSKINKIKEK